MKQRPSTPREVIIVSRKPAGSLHEQYVELVQLREEVDRLAGLSGTNFKLPRNVAPRQNLNTWLKDSDSD